MRGTFMSITRSLLSLNRVNSIKYLQLRVSGQTHEDAFNQFIQKPVATSARPRVTNFYSEESLRSALHGYNSTQIRTICMRADNPLILSFDGRERTTTISALTFRLKKRLGIERPQTRRYLAAIVDGMDHEEALEYAKLHTHKDFYSTDALKNWANDVSAEWIRSRSIVNASMVSLISCDEVHSLQFSSLLAIVAGMIK